MTTAMAPVEEKYRLSWSLITPAPLAPSSPTCLSSSQLWWEFKTVENIKIQHRIGHSKNYCLQIMLGHGLHCHHFRMALMNWNTLTLVWFVCTQMRTESKRWSSHENTHFPGPHRGLISCFWYLWPKTHKKLRTVASYYMTSHAERLFQCVFCSKNFQRRYLRRRHERLTL